MNAVLEKLKAHKLVPVIAIPNVDAASDLAEALVSGGLPVAEVTFRLADADKAIKAMAARGDMAVGAGTVLKIDQVKQAVDNGATYIVSPGFNPKVVGYCVENDIPITPGISNPTDIEMALEFDLEVVKFFPAEAYGGLKTLKAMAAPYNMMQFIPTGGINANNLLDYLKYEKVWACGGSWMVKKDLIAGGKFDEIQRLTKEAVELAGQAL